MLFIKEGQPSLCHLLSWKLPPWPRSVLSERTGSFFHSFFMAMRKPQSLSYAVASSLGIHINAGQI